MPEEAGPELSEGNKKFIEIEAPERLEVGQNLYDQEPFLNLVNNICESSGKTPDAVRTNISYFAKLHFDKTTSNPKFQAIELLKKVDYLQPALRIPFDYKLKMLETLQAYPYWSEYIAQRLLERKYGSKGSFIYQHQAKGERQAPSYANWVTQKLQREKRLWTVGIEEVFPQEVSHPITSQPNITGIRTRHFRILTAAEIIKEKR